MMDRRAILGGVAALTATGPLATAHASPPPVTASRILDAHALCIEAIPKAGVFPARRASFYRGGDGDVFASSPPLNPR